METIKHELNKYDKSKLIELLKESYYLHKHNEDYPILTDDMNVLFKLTGHKDDSDVIDTLDTIIDMLEHTVLQRIINDRF